MPNLSAKADQFMQRLLHPIWFRLFLLWKLPMAFWAGLRVVSVSTDQAQVSVPYKNLNKNPFNSTYFAVLSMAGEMATGVLGLLAIENSSSPIAILVVGLEAEFSKKATDISTFTCTDGKAFFDAVDQTTATGEAVTVTALSIGKNQAGEEVARFRVTWSLKKRK
jgi:hypothetical protein